MRFHTILLLALPLLSWAQTPPAAPPPEVDQALRARVTAFLQFQKEGSFRKAYDMVSEDSKDYYFSAPKQQSSSFQINEIQYTGDFSKATVRATVTQRMGLAGQYVEVPNVLAAQWRLENGVWMWYHDPDKGVLYSIIGPISTGGAPSAPPQPARPSALPKDMSPEAVAAAAAKLVPKATIDKKSVTFTLGKEATEEVTFHNNNPGQVQVYVGVQGDTDSVTVEPHSALLNPQAELAVKVTYKPAKDTFARTAIQFTVEPFGSVYVLPVRAVREGSDPKP